MKTLAYAVVTASLFALPIASFAQATQSDNQPLTRAEVKQQLIDLEKAGYNPSASNDATYPREIQAAEARVAAEKTNQGYGPGMSGSGQSGQQMAPMTAPANSGQ
jgi:hypothetical protein